MLSITIVCTGQIFIYVRIIYSSYIRLYVMLNTEKIFGKTVHGFSFYCHHQSSDNIKSKLYKKSKEFGKILFHNFVNINIKY